jgi:hypothetical protein
MNTFEMRSIYILQKKERKKERKKKNNFLAYKNNITSPMGNL